MTKKHNSDCDHIIGYFGIDDNKAQIVRKSSGYTFDDLVADGVKFDYCPLCGEHFNWLNSESE